MNLQSTISAIKAVDASLEDQARRKIDLKTKPLGSLGRLEEIAVRLCQMQNTLNPAVARRALVVFAADHGVVAEGVSAFPAEVTPQMVQNFLNGGAAINVLCRQQGIALQVADMGVAVHFADHPLLIQAKIRKGTRSFLREAALTGAEAVAALEKGIEIFEKNVLPGEPNIVAVGEMGIGNSTSAAAIIAAVCQRSVAEVTGGGTGIDDQGLTRKIAVIEQALAFHKPMAHDGLDVLAKVGGLEIAGIAGFILAASAHRVPTVLDGLIATSGGLIAATLCPDVKSWLFSGHRSIEIGQAVALEKLGLVPLVDLGLRLGEGTGAALAIHYIDAAARIMTEMSSFEEAGVTNRE